MAQTRTRSRPAKAKAAPKAAPGVLAMPTEMTIYHAAELRTVLLAAVDAGTVRLDLAQVTEFDSTGLQLLLAARRSARANGRHLELVNMPRVVLDVCSTYGLDETFEPSLENLP